jgi:hypothetical protein
LFSAKSMIGVLLYLCFVSMSFLVVVT